MNETHWHAEWCWLTGLWCVRLLPIGVCLNFAREWKPRASACDPISDSEVVFLLWDVLYMICLAIHEGCKSAGICSKTSLPSAEINLAELIDTTYSMRPVPSGKGYINVLEPTGHTLQAVDSRALLTSMSKACIVESFPAKLLIESTRLLIWSKWRRGFFSGPKAGRQNTNASVDGNAAQFPLWRRSWPPIRRDSTPLAKSFYIYADEFRGSCSPQTSVDSRISLSFKGTALYQRKQRRHPT